MLLCQFYKLKIPCIDKARDFEFVIQDRGVILSAGQKVNFRRKNAAFEVFILKKLTEALTASTTHTPCVRSDLGQLYTRKMSD